MRKKPVPSKRNLPEQFYRVADAICKTSGQKSDIAGQMTFDALLGNAETAPAASPEVTALRRELGAIARLTPMERYALVLLARALTKSPNNKNAIRKKVNRLLE